MTQSDLRRECIRDKWLPLLVYTFEGQSYLPLFPTPDVVFSFAKRNLPRNWFVGYMTFSEEELEFFLADKPNWLVSQMNYPRKLHDCVDFDVSIHHLNRGTAINILG